MNIKVKDLMSNQIIYVKEDAIVAQAGELFDRHAFHHLPVLKDGRCTGIFSKSDFLQLQDKSSRLLMGRYEEINERFLNSLLVREVMTKDPSTISSDAPAKEALSLFLQNRYRCLIVMEDEDFVGMLTPYDFLEYLHENS